MSSDLKSLPLFPLNTVLFPHAEIHLHVFEDRYRELIRECIQNDSGFGVCLIKEGTEVGDQNIDPYMVGTYARIISVHTYDDGRMDVKVRGVSRFRIRKLKEDFTYLVGSVEPVSEETTEDSPRINALVLRTREILQEYITSYFERNEIQVAHINLPNDPTALSFYVANFLQIENLQKQFLLETTDTVDRIATMLPILEEHKERADEEAAVDEDSPNIIKLTPNDFQEWVTPN